MKYCIKILLYCFYCVVICFCSCSDCKKHGKCGALKIFLTGFALKFLPLPELKMQNNSARILQGEMRKARLGRIRFPNAETQEKLLSYFSTVTQPFK